MEKREQARSFERGLDLRRQGRLQEALEVFQGLEAVNPKSAAFSGFVAEVLWELDRLAEGERSARKTVRLAPDSDLASKVLYFVLWDAGKSDEAVQEIRRFLSRHQDLEYEEILAEMKELGLLPDDLDASET